MHVRNFHPNLSASKETPQQLLTRASGVSLSPASHLLTPLCHFDTVHLEKNSVKLNLRYGQWTCVNLKIYVQLSCQINCLLLFKVDFLIFFSIEVDSPAQPHPHHPRHRSLMSPKHNRKSLFTNVSRIFNILLEQYLDGWSFLYLILDH